MSNTITIKNGTGSSTLAPGELAYQTSEKKLYIGTSSGTNEVAAAPSSHNHNASNINAGTLGVARGGTGATTHTSNAILAGNGTSAIKNIATASGAFYATSANGAASFGTLPLAQGGTGASLSPTANAIIRYSGSSSNFSSTATGNGALYATDTNAVPSFGTLPIAQGGTGATSASAALTALGGATSDHKHAFTDVTSGTVPASRGGTGRDTLTANSFLVGNGTSAVKLRTASQVLSDIGAAASEHTHSASDVGAVAAGYGMGVVTGSGAASSSSSVTIETPGEMVAVFISMRTADDTIWTHDICYNPNVDSAVYYCYVKLGGGYEEWPMQIAKSSSTKIVITRYSTYSAQINCWYTAIYKK